MWETLQKMRIGTVSRLRFCRRFSWPEFYFRWNIVHFRKPHVRSNQLDKKQTSVSRSSTESEIISLDAGLRLDGTLELDVWDLIVTVLHGITYQSNQERGDACTNLVRATPHKLQTRTKSHGMTDDPDNVDFISSNVHSSREEALLHIFEDNEAVIKVIIKGKKPYHETWFPEHTELLLIGRLIESIWTPRSKSNTLTPITNSQTYWPFDTWWMESSFVFVQLQPFQLHQQRQSDVEKKARRCRWRVSHSKIKADDEFGLAIQRKGSKRACLDCIGTPGKTKSESQIPLSSWNEQQPRTGRPVMGASSSDYPEWNIDEKWSSWEWREIWCKCWKQERRDPWVDNGSPRTQTSFVIDDDDMDSDTATETDISLKSRPFLNRVNDRLRKNIGPFFKRCNARHRHMFFIWGMFMSSTLEASVFMGKDYSENLHSIKKNRKGSHSEQDVWHIWKTDDRTIRWDLWSVSNQLGRFFMETIIFGQWWRSHQSIACKGFCISDSVLCLGKVNQNPTSISVWKRQLEWFKDSPQYRTLNTIDGEPMEFEWNIFPGFSTLQLVSKVQEFMTKMDDPSQIQRTNYLHVDVQCPSYVDLKTMSGNANVDATLVSKFPKDFHQDVGHSWDLDQKKKWYSTYIDRPRGEWDRVTEFMMIKFRRKRTPSFLSNQSTVPRNAQKQKRWKIINTLLCRLKLFFAQSFLLISSVSTEQPQIFAMNTVLVKQERGRPVVAEESDPLFETARLLMKTPTLSTEVPAQEDLLQKYKERVERLSQQNRVIKICTVGVGQYFMTKHTDELFQFTEPVTCREYTFPRDEKTSDPKGWIRGNT